MGKEKFGSIEVIEVWPRKTATAGLLEKLILASEMGGCYCFGRLFEMVGLWGFFLP